MMNAIRVSIVSVGVVLVLIVVFMGLARYKKRKRWLTAYHKNQALIALEHLRNGEYGTWFKLLLEDVSTGGFTLEEVGSSEQELEELKAEEQKVNANK